MDPNSARYPTALALFELHQQQLKERREKIHSISERTVGAFLVIGGWVLVSNPHVSVELRLIFTAVVLSVVLAVLRMLWQNNKSYLRIAQVVRNLNEALGTFEKGEYLNTRALYHESWKQFGEEPPLKAIWPHLLSVVAIGILPIGAIWI